MSALDDPNDHSLGGCVSGRERVLITGGAGAIGQVLRAGLPQQGWLIRSIDVNAAERVDPDEEILTGDLQDPALLESACADCHAVVHLAASPSERPWPTIRSTNIDLTFAVFEAARRAGMSRIVYASSIHASGFTPHSTLLSTGEPPRPDTLYGVSKVFGETLGRLYHDRHGVAVACVRIGAFADRPTNLHSLAHWLSPGDCVRLTHACLSAPELGYALVYGRSANARGWTDLASARELGYEPQDDAEVYAEAISDPGMPDTVLGGVFTTVDFDASRMR